MTQQAAPAEHTPSTLELTFHGRILDHLGLQMYQSPVAAVAELVSNSWDADAASVSIVVPQHLTPESTLVIEDSGVGMTAEECQRRYLNVGYNRRGKTAAARTGGQRPVLGRKGIGKFAGFGIARLIKIKTVSGITGEQTEFTLNFQELRGDEDAYESTPKVINLDAYLAPDEARKSQQGTRIELCDLQLAVGINPDAFARSMARRFLLLERAQGFQVLVNGKSMSESGEAAEGVAYSFPRDYAPGEASASLSVVDERDWGTEALPSGDEVQWQIVFYRDTIKEEDLRGVAVFANGKLAQSPFLFNIRGGIGNQANLEYMSGRVEAAYLDALPVDVISTERQRINWEHPSAKPLEDWGAKRIKELVALVGNRNAAAKAHKLVDRMSPLGERLGKLQRYERKTVERALLALAKVDRLSQERFEALGDAMLTAWEQGRLKDLVHSLAGVAELSEDEVIGLFWEADVLTALHVAEAVKTKLEVIQGLRQRIKSRDLENAVRDYIAERPWLISPHWDTYRVERSLEGVLKDLAGKAKLDAAPDFVGRVDLLLASGHDLLLLEFMRPGLKIDRDHLTRFGGYVDEIRSYLSANTGGQFKNLTGYLVADKLDASPALMRELRRLGDDSMFAKDWDTLLREAEGQWRDFLFSLKERSPEDPRLVELAATENEDGTVAAASVPIQESASTSN